MSYNPVTRMHHFPEGTSVSDAEAANVPPFKESTLAPLPASQLANDCAFCEHHAADIEALITHVRQQHPEKLQRQQSPLPASDSPVLDLEAIKQKVARFLSVNR